MDIWLILGTISLLLGLWFLVGESYWRTLGWLMLEFGLMFLFSALLLRWQLPKTHTPNHQLSALVLVLFLYAPAFYLACVSCFCGHRQRCLARS